MRLASCLEDDDHFEWDAFTNKQAKREKRAWDKIIRLDIKEKWCDTITKKQQELGWRWIVYILTNIRK